MFDPRYFLGALGVVLALSAGASAGPLISDGLVVYYSFDGIGTSVADGSGNGYDGTVYGNVTYTSSGKIGGAASMIDRVPDNGGYVYNYVALPVDDLLAAGRIPTTNFTVSGWIKMSEKSDIDPGDDNQYESHTLFSSKTTEGTYVVHSELAPHKQSWNDEGYRFCARAYDPDGSNGGAGNNIGNFMYETPDGYEFYDVWRHVAMTYDQSTTTMAIYVDGELMQHETDCQDLPMAYKWDAGAYVGANPQPARQLFGSIDEFYLYDATLSAGAINALAHTSLPGDADLDLDVDLADLGALGDNWGGTGKGWSQGDFNDDGVVDLSDLGVLGDNWGANAVEPLMSFSAAKVAVGVVPEPGTLALLVAATLGMAAFYLRRRK